MLLKPAPSPASTLPRLGAALRRARKLVGKDNSDDFGRDIGVSGRTLRGLEATGKGSTESLVRVLLAVCPQALEELIKNLERLEAPFSSVDEALANPSTTKERK